MIRVLIIEEVRAIGEVIATALRSEPDMDVIGCASNIDEAAAQLHASDLVLVHTSMSTEPSVRLIRALRQLSPRTKIVVMGLPRSQQALAQCVEARVAGYVFRDSCLGELLQRVRAAAGSGAFASPPFAVPPMSYVGDLVGFEPGDDPDACSPDSLTRREREVLTLVQQGLTNQEIAETLVIELGTVKNHVHNILRKLNVNTRREAVQVWRLADHWGGDETPVHSQLHPNPGRLVLRREPASLFSAVMVGAAN